MKTQQSGFTLIELIVVIVILGILAAVAVPRFVDLSEEAELATLEATAGAMGSAMAMNYAACLLDVGSSKCVPVTTCENVESLMQGGISGYKVHGGSLGSNLGDPKTCQVTLEGGNPAGTPADPFATFTGIYTKEPAGG